MSKLYVFRCEQVFRTSRAALWDFIASPNNLERITPPYMGFEVLTPSSERMFAGQVIAYYVRPLFGIRMNWITEITHVENGVYFVDEQRFGPYAFWHHLHRLEDTSEGVKMTDVVHYKIPFGTIGDLANALVVRKRLDEIFDYRRRVLTEMFGASPVE